METMPFSSFLFMLNKKDPETSTLIAQGVVVALVLLVGAWQTRTYWRQLRSFEERDREAAARASATV
jgi:hypothetical protein